VFEKSFNFLIQLKKNNNREWYHKHKDLYEDAREEFEHVSELLIHEVSAFDNAIAGLRPKDCIFRIFRDIRFSSDKSPYKTNFGAYFAPGGKKSLHAGYYFHIEPGESMIAAGIYMPPSNILAAIRQEIYSNAEEFKEILNEKKLKKVFGELSGEKLKTGPKGFPKDFPDIEMLKFKNYGLIATKSDSEIKKPDIIRVIVDFFRISYPFVQFLNEAIKNSEA